MIVNSEFRSLNGHDDLYITVSQKPQRVVKAYEKREGDTQTFLHLYEDGTARFGVTKFHDPLHANGKYTWSSNAKFINSCFKLWGTKDEVVECAIKYLNEYDCYYAGAIRTSIAQACAEAQPQNLKYGILQYLGEIHNNKIKEVVSLEDGDEIYYDK